MEEGMNLDNFSETVQMEVSKLVSEGVDKILARKKVLERMALHNTPSDKDIFKLMRRHNLCYEDARHALIVSRGFKSLKKGGLDSHGAIDELTRKMTKSLNVGRDVVSVDSVSSSSHISRFEERPLPPKASNGKGGNMHILSEDEKSEVIIDPSSEKQKFLRGELSPRLKSDKKRSKRSSPNDDNLDMVRRSGKRVKTERSVLRSPSNRSANLADESKRKRNIHAVVSDGEEGAFQATKKKSKTFH